MGEQPECAGASNEEIRARAGRTLARLSERNAAYTDEEVAADVAAAVDEVARGMAAGARIPAEPVVVRHRASAYRDVAAMRVGTVLYADERHEQHGGWRRYFWLLDHQAQLVYEPFGWADEWYVDIVSIAREDGEAGAIYTVRDLEIDIVVEGRGPTYRLIDLEKFGARMVAGEFTPAEAADALARAQTFLDAFLHRGAPWPPPAIMPFFSPALWDNGGRATRRG